MGMYDLPASIDFVLKPTGRKKLMYVGFSQGTTSYFVMTSSRPKYNDKIEAMFALGSVAYCENMSSPIVQFLAKLRYFVKLILYLLMGFTGEFKPTNRFFEKFSSLLCNDESILHPVCVNALFLIVGIDWNGFDRDLLPQILHHVPAGASIRQFMHFARLIRKGGFQSPDRIEYNLYKIRSKIFLYHSKNDWISSVSDVKELSDNLPNLQKRFLLPNKLFNHIDFLWSKNVKKELYYQVINDMSRFVSA
ncbi:hypothetical protein TKK_0019037 [Trichogramma kaykai]|uniref:AB hydrolase-1 domain-containing protein n=1 Tax=Trichogramma kaykai TaxID=54128 RepID=A0ABD2VVK7_9HYME